MRMQIILYLLLLSILAGAGAYALVYFFAPAESPGRGLGGTAIQRYLLIPIAVVPATFLIGLTAYLALFPDIAQRHPATPEPTGEPQPLAAVMKVLKEDERKVVELLVSSGGRMLQRDIARQTGFTRVKTHRILFRLAGRGIITATKYYNTYEITLADWLFQKK